MILSSFYPLLVFSSLAATSIKISNLLICFCSFDFCSILEKDNFIEHLYSVLS